MSKSWPNYMGTYKGIVLDCAIQKTKNKGLPMFVVRIALTDYYDQKESEWYDVSDNNWVMNAYLCLYGREGSQEDGEIIPTLNHQQVCKVFDWDGCGFTYLAEPGKFDSKVIQVRIAENTGDNAKSPVQIVWIDTEDADPNAGLQKLDPTQVKALGDEFSYLWKGKKPALKAAAAPKKAKPPAPKPEPVITEVVDEPPKAETKEDRKKILLEKSKRLRKESAKSEPPAPRKSEPPKADDSAVPADYGKRQAWSDIIELRAEECTDNQQKASWDVAIAETAPDGDEDKLDAAGWWAVKEQVVADVGQF